MKYGTQRHLDYIRRRLEQKCRTKKSVKVRYVENLNMYAKNFGLKPLKRRKRLGLTLDAEHWKYILILIEKNMGFEIKAQTLVHEWAHALTPMKAPGHGLKWARNYHKAYHTIYLKI